MIGTTLANSTDNNVIAASTMTGTRARHECQRLLVAGPLKRVEMRDDLAGSR